MRNRRSPIAVVLLAFPLALAGCAKKDDGAKPSAVPPLGSGAPQPGAAAPTPAAPPPAAPAPTAPAPGADKPAASGPGGSITGQIVLAPSLAKKKPSGTLFLVARRPSDNPSARGTLIAVKKLPATTFPIPFTLSAADMPFQQGALEGELVLTARIDQDGDPLSRQKGDVFGSLPKVQVGAKDVKLSLDQLQTEAESLAQPGAGQGGPEPNMGGSGRPPGHP